MSAQATHSSYLVHNRFRYLKLAVILTILCMIPYFAWEPPEGHNGGTWLGYTLGTIGGLLILWLMWLGIRKRRYTAGNWSLKAWTSAHVYLGLSLTIIATLHAGFQVGWNIHTLAYVLMMLVIISGMFGVGAYGYVPSRQTENRMGQTLADMAGEMMQADERAAELTIGLPDEFSRLVELSRDQTRIGGSTWKIITGMDRSCGTTKALRRALELSKDLPPDQAQKATALIQTLGQKHDLVRRARRDLRYKGFMDLWLFIHVPISLALLAALLAHVISVFFYWA